MTAPECRFCNAPLAHKFVDLGLTPLANSYISPERLDSREPSYPLRAFACSECWLVQTDTVIPPEDIFSDYAYFSSYSDSWVEHARQFVLMAIQRFGLNEASKVVEIASNDGYLLRHFMAASIPVLGIEPASNVAEAAVTSGIPTEVRFFNKTTANDLVARNVYADLVIGNNVLAHVPDINSFVDGLSTIVKPDGVVCVEFPHILRLMEGRQFDTIYHEHFYYLSLLAVEKVFQKYDLRVFDVEELPTHGGSLRVLASRAASAAYRQSEGLAKIRSEEARSGLDCIAAYEKFQARIEPIRNDLLAFLHEAKYSGKKVVAYGAAAKGNTLLNYCGIGTDLIAYVVDRNPHKQGRFLPGSRLPIYAPDRIEETRPDFVLILPWNIADEIISANNGIKSWGGCFVTAIPQLRIFA